jgi:hypothetical protein
MANKVKRRGLLRFLGLGAAGASAMAVAGASTPAQAAPEPTGAPSKYAEGTTGWAYDQVRAGHRVRQRSWETGEGAEDPVTFKDVFGSRYEKGINSFTGLPIFTEMLYGSDWEIVP